VFAGLVLTSISAAVLQAALFQRKSRSGWLEELDGIREDALAEPGAGADVVDGAGIWTDLRDGGEYADPHEISSLYATDATPDLPVTKPPSRAGAKPPARSARSKAKAAPTDAPAPPAPTPAPAVAEAAAPPPPPPPPPSAAPLPPPPAVEPAPSAELPVDGVPGLLDAAPSGQYDDQIWVQPAPHPIRPSEMWHPAELAPAPLPEETFEPVLEERVASSELMDPTYRHVAEPVADPALTAHLESELTAAADTAVGLGPSAEGGLVNGPVGRRVRRDRPQPRAKAQLPPVPASDEVELDRGEQSPLPSAPLPPAALPTRSNRLPGLELPATPSSVVAPRPAPVVEPRTVEPVAVEPVEVEATPVAEPAPAPPVAEVLATEADPEPEPAVPAPAPIAIGVDGLVDAPGTIVRIGGPRRARAVGSPQGVVVALDEGWCWASPGEGAAAPLRIDLPSGMLTVEPGATALAVVEADESAFIIVAAGSAYLSRGGDGVTVERGTIVMVDPAGIAHTDAATDAEIEADPIVAENLSLDAEL
jgi:hypothetical protein